MDSQSGLASGARIQYRFPRGAGTDNRIIIDILRVSIDPVIIGESLGGRRSTNPHDILELVFFASIGTDFCAKFLFENRKVPPCMGLNATEAVTQLRYKLHLSQGQTQGWVREGEPPGEWHFQPKKMNVNFLEKL